MEKNEGNGVVNVICLYLVKDMIRCVRLTGFIAIPTLFIKTKKRLNITSWQIKLYKTYLNNLHVKKVRGNHWAFGVAPESFNEAIKIF
jgi:hypothetical protein